MTVPRLAQRGRYGRTYPWPPPPDDPTWHVPSVTTVLGKLAKPALVGWAARTASEAAVRMAKSGALAALIEQSDQQAVDALKDVHNHNRDAAGAIGTTVHDALEAWATGGELPALGDAAADTWVNLSVLIDQLEMEVMHSEVTVYGDLADESTAYAGTADLIASIEVPGRGRRTLVVDLKTNKGGAYPEASYQVAALRNATKLVTRDGQLIPMPDTDGGLILTARPEGAAAVPVISDGPALDVFRACRQLHHLTTAGTKFVRPALNLENNNA